MGALVICRFAHFMAAAQVFGASAYLWLYAPQDLRRALFPSIWRIGVVSSVVALLSAVLLLALEAATMADDWWAAIDRGVITAVLADTDFGRVWLFRLFLAVALTAVVLLRPQRWATITVAAGLLLASLALVGHAAMRTGFQGVFQRGNSVVHLLAAGAWLGGLTAFIGSLGAYAVDRLRRDAVHAMARFSCFGQFIVAAIVVTGMVNIALVSGHPPFPPTTSYRALLDAKFVAVGLMVSLAVLNRYYLMPQLRSDATGLAVLRATSAIEVVLGTVVVALVSVFALLDPA
jgi:copper resistance protein D